MESPVGNGHKSAQSDSLGFELENQQMNLNATKAWSSLSI